MLELHACFNYPKLEIIYFNLVNLQKIFEFIFFVTLFSLLMLLLVGSASWAVTWNNAHQPYSPWWIYVDCSYFFLLHQQSLICSELDCSYFFFGEWIAVTSIVIDEGFLPTFLWKKSFYPCMYIIVYNPFIFTFGDKYIVCPLQC